MTMFNSSYAGYDSFAWLYDQNWGAQHQDLTLDILDRLLFSKLPPPARILDLCCGAGHVTKILAEHGYQMVGLDGSAEMLHYARQKLPRTEFILADARDFNLPPTFDAAISTFDSLNHIMTASDLLQVFGNVYRALVDDGSFLFDLNTEEAYLTQWQKSSVTVEDTYTFIIRGGYDAATLIGHTDITMFRLGQNGWIRSDATFWQKCHLPEEVQDSLELAGFRSVMVYDACRDLELSADRMVGRYFFLAIK